MLIQWIIQGINISGNGVVKVQLDLLLAGYPYSEKVCVSQSEQ